MPLINNADILKNHLGGVQTVINWETWEGFCDQADRLYIRPAIGNALYAEMLALVTPNTKQTELLSSLRYASAYYAYLIGIPQLVTVMGDSGISISNPAQAQPMAKWLYVDLKKQITNKAEMWLESALAYLEEESADFPTWTNDTQFQQANNLFIRSARQLTMYFPDARSSRRLFLSLIPYLRESEKITIQEIISPELYTDLKTKIGNASPISLTEELAIDLIRYSLAYHAFAQAIPSLNISEDFRLIQETDGIQNEDYLSDSRRSELQRVYSDRFETYAAKLKRLLDGAAGQLPVYQESDTYKSTLPRTYERPQNDSSKPYYIL